MHKRRVTTLTLIAVGLVAAACAPASRVVVRHPSVRPAAAVVTTTTTTTTLPPATTVPRPAPIVVNRSAPLPHPTTIPTPPSAENGTGLASWYDPPWGGYTFASRTMPRGTVVTFAYGGRTVTATCRDYGPAVWTGRQFDLSRAAFEALASTGAGVIQVSWHYG